MNTDAILFCMAFVKRWEITVLELENSIGKKYKVTRMLPEFFIAETKVFRSKEDAKQQFDEWLALQ
jgi:hypothetical protein